MLDLKLWLVKPEAETEFCYQIDQMQESFKKNFDINK